MGAGRYSCATPQKLRRIQESWDAAHKEGRGQKGRNNFSYCFGFSSQSFVEFCGGSVKAMFPFYLNLKLPGCDADPRKAFFFTALLLIHTSFKKVLPLIRFNCPAICYVVGRLVLKSLN